MARAPRVLRSIAAAWLFCWATTMTLVPAVLWLGPVDASVAQCACPHGADATCPMHHQPAASSTLCVIQSATANSTASLGALFSIVGLVSDRSVAIAHLTAVSGVVLERSTTTERPSPPDPPPPRA